MSFLRSGFAKFSEGHWIIFAAPPLLSIYGVLLGKFSATSVLLDLTRTISSVFITNHTIYSPLVKD
jgi:hypothetical protein